MPGRERLHASRVASYTFRYTSRYEPSSGRDIIVQPKADEAVEQFRLLASFYFRSFFHVDRTYVESLCRTQASHHFDTTVPRAFVPKFFDLGKHGTQPETVGFVQFLEKVLAMPRKQYRLLISCLTGYFEALEAIGKNFDLAYSMMVYMLEALSKSVEPPEPVWEDYDQKLRGKLDKQLASADPKTAEGVRAILLSNPHLKLKKRFVAFTAGHTGDSSFTSEAEGLRSALAKSELGRVLGNLYDAQSGYVHELRQVQEQLRHGWVGTDSDVFNWLNEPHFTFAGLVRLGRHVLASFIDRQPVLEREEYPDWRMELPGTTQGVMAPEDRVWRSENFHPAQARKRFSGFVDHLVSNYTKPRIPLLDLRSLMVRIEESVPSAKAHDRPPMLALYWTYNGIIPEGDRRAGWDAFLARWDSATGRCEVEFLVMFIVLGHRWPWPVSECVAAFEQYLRRGTRPPRRTCRGWQRSRSRPRSPTDSSTAERSATTRNGSSGLSWTRQGGRRSRTTSAAAGQTVGVLMCSTFSVIHYPKTQKTAAPIRVGWSSPRVCYGCVPT